MRSAVSLKVQGAEPLPIFPRYGVARGALGRLAHWYYRLVCARADDFPVLERVGDMPVVVLPGVLNPRLMRSGAFFATQLDTGLIAPGAEVLDMGTGSGVCAIAAAQVGARVVAVDIAATAVRCTQINARINALEERIEVLQGDLFAPVQGRRFDVVLFNPPFIRGVPRDDADRAWRSTDVAERFAAGLAQHLTREGSALVVLSTYGDGEQFVRQFRRHGFEMELVAIRDFVNERLSLLRLRQAAACQEAP